MFLHRKSLPFAVKAVFSLFCGKCDISEAADNKGEFSEGKELFIRNRPVSYACACFKSRAFRGLWRSCGYLVLKANCGCRIKNLLRI